jgi:hypothetical protein
MSHAWVVPWLCHIWVPLGWEDHEDKHDCSTPLQFGGTVMKQLLKLSAVLACVALVMPVTPIFGQAGMAPGQISGEVTPPTGVGASPGQIDRPDAASRPSVVEPSIADTTLTARGHQIAAGASSGNLEGTACPATHKMISGACHPGYTDQVRIINQFPNIAANTWRCGFRNATGSAVTAWIYTLCGR